jgi:GNAT superfamily N-acetyltransferase
MYRIVRTNSSNPDFIDLVQHLDADLAIRDGDEHAFYHQFNAIDNLNYVIVIYENDIPLACGAFKEIEKETVEVKRMFTAPFSRRKGMGSMILKELESWDFEMNYNKCILETGKRQPEAIALYKKSGYDIIPNFGPYSGVENSVCFEKSLN